MKRLLALLAVAAALLLGCAQSSPEKSLVVDWLELRKAGTTPHLITAPPFIDWVVPDKQIDRFNRFYLGIAQPEGRDPIAKDSLKSWIAFTPVLDYDIQEVKAQKDGSTLVIVKEKVVDEERFRDLLGQPALGKAYSELREASADHSLLGVSTYGRAQDNLRAVSAEFVKGWSSSRKAIETTAVEDTVTYQLIKGSDGTPRIAFYSARSARAEQKKAAKTARIRPLLAKMTIINPRAVVYSGETDVFVKAEIAYAADSKIDDLVDFQVELLKADGTVLARDTGFPGPFEPGSTVEALALIRKARLDDWSGKYRVRLGINEDWLPWVNLER